MKRQQKRYRKRRGYILLMVIAMIAMAALFLAGLARYSIQSSLESVRAAEELQFRWGTLSCQQALLLHPQKYLTPTTDEHKNKESSALPVIRQTAQIVLGSMTFQLLLADEDAKLSLNSLYVWKGRSGVEDVLQKAVAATDGLEVQLCPYRNRSSDAMYPAFDSWGQVFAGVSQPEAIEAATQEITCWGQKLNTRIASDELLRSVVRWVLASQETDRLMTLRRQKPDMPLDDLFKQAGATGHEAEQLKQLLCEDSNCYSLWIIAQGKQRTRSQLAVATGDSNEKKRTHISCFDW